MTDVDISDSGILRVKTNKTTNRIKCFADKASDFKQFIECFNENMTIKELKEKLFS